MIKFLEKISTNSFTS